MAGIRSPSSIRPWITQIRSMRPFTLAEIAFPAGAQEQVVGNLVTPLIARKMGTDFHPAFVGKPYKVTAADKGNSSLILRLRQGNRVLRYDQTRSRHPARRLAIH